MRPIFILFVIIFVCISGLYSQNIHQTIPAGGGNANGTGGKVSYSVGQVFYTVKSGHNGTVAEGVQQPYEISIITGIEVTKINLSIFAYPNPTKDILKLIIDNTYLTGLNFQLFDISGKQLEVKNISDRETLINTSNLSKGAYLLYVNNASKTIKSFKIIKN